MNNKSAMTADTANLANLKLMKSGRILLNIAAVVYMAVAIFISIYYIANKQLLMAFLGPVSLLFLLIPRIAEGLLKIKLGNYITAFMLLFISFSFQFGVVLRLYDTVVLHDIVAHLLSGIFFAIIGMCFYAKLNPSFTSRSSAFLFQLSYAFFCSLSIAVLWEIGEFIAFLITGHDMQHHLDTGVFDTMEDIIACFVGTLMACGDFYMSFKKKKRFPLGQMLLQFDFLNLLGDNYTSN